MRIAMALQIQPRLLARGAMRKGHVIIRNLVEKVNLVLLQHQRSGNAVDRRIAPALVEESALMVEEVEVIHIRLAAQPVKTADLEIRPEMAVVPGIPPIIREETHTIILLDMLGMALHKLLHRIPQRRHRLDVLKQRQHKGVLLIVLLHEAEGVEGDVAVQLDARLHAPVELVLLHQRMAEEEPALVAAHVAITDRVAVDDLALPHILPHGGGFILIDEIGKTPVFFADLAVPRPPGDEVGSDLLEVVVEFGVVEEDPVVVEVAVEAVFDLADAAGDVPGVSITSKGDKGGVDAAAGVGDGEVGVVVPGVGGGVSGSLWVSGRMGASFSSATTESLDSRWAA